MKLRKIGKFYHAEFKTQTGTIKSVSTKATELSEAKRLAKEAGIEQLEHAAKAGRITQQVIGQITTGRKLTMEKAIAEFSEWQHSISRSVRTIDNKQQIFDRWLAWDKGLSTLPPAAITEKHISPFVNRQDSPAGA